MKKILKGIILIAGLAIIAPPQSHAQVSVGLSVRIGPPAIPVYEQPYCPVDGYIWTPGYWAYGSDGYYWVPGAWVAPPTVGLLWTPCWWGFDGGVYAFHAGYWGPHVGFYGGINYGFGYGGSGYYGGRWSGGRFQYNTSVTRVNRSVVHNTYVNNSFPRNNSHASFNGRGGVTARPSKADEMAAHDRHISPTSNQMAHQRSASQNRSQFASVNHGRPATTAVSRIGSKPAASRTVANHTNASHTAANRTAPSRAEQNRTNRTSTSAGHTAYSSRPSTSHAQPSRASHSTSQVAHNNNGMNHEANVQHSVAHANTPHNNERISMQQHQASRAPAPRPMNESHPSGGGGHPSGGNPGGHRK